MSDDTNERMDRAKRIRQMREGQRAAAEERAEDDDEAGAEADVDEAQADDETPASESAPDDDSDTDRADPDEEADDWFDEDGPSDERESDRATAGETSDATDENDQSTDMGTNSNTEHTTEETGAQDNDAEESAGDGQEVDPEVMAAAQRAAQNAAQVGGDGAAQVAAGDAGTDAAVETAAAETAVSDSAAGETGVTEAGTQQVESTAAPAQGPTGIELPDEETIQSAIADEVLESDGFSGTARAGVVDDQAAATQEETVRVLEFTLGSEHYCLDITHVEEIVKRESITRVPNTPEYVEGVVDLRGQITTILNPKDLLDIDEQGPESLLVVFAPDEFEDQGAIGWVVDAVRQVVPVAESEINDPPVDEDYIEGVVDRDDEDEFVIWTDPEVAIRMATADGDD